mgnify:FL=1
MIRKYLAFLKEIIDKLDREPIGALIEELVRLQRRKGRLFILGVGGSAANASHAVNDFRNLCEIEAYCPSDNVAELTARTNDEGWETVFKEWLKISKLNENDLLLIFSVGGGDEKRKISVNLIEAIKYAKRTKTKIAGVVGRDGGYVKKEADICILIPTVNEYLITPFVESFQSIIWHLMVFKPDLNIKNGKWEEIALEK